MTRKRKRVTPIRYSTGRLSGSCNKGAHGDPIRDADRCHYCRVRFEAGQMRYPIWTEVIRLWQYGLASICMACFKEEATDSETTKLERFERECHGCGEPILTPMRGPWAWQTCSTRCNQRYARKRKHQWRQCKACKQGFTPTRNDARFCSDKCRQWHYRRRKAAA
jgi:hypothetical protein